MSQPVIGYIAEVDSRNFSFEGHGATEEEAREALKSALGRHGEQCDLEDGWHGYLEDSIVVRPFIPGQGFRDREPVN